MTVLLEAVLQRDELASMDPAARRLALRRLLHDEGAGACLPAIVDHVDGCGPLGPLMRDPEVTDILVNGHSDVWIERAGELQPTDTRFESPQDLLDLIERMLGRAGRRADAAHPVEDARLADGSRMHVVMPPLSGAEPAVSIRLFPRTPRTLSDLVDARMLTGEQAETLDRWVRLRHSILIAGATGTGKTTLLGALLARIPASERVITIEETPEIHASGHRVGLIARAPNTEGGGGVDLEALLRASLRMRPDRIVIGEVRGPEARIAVDAMSTGHEGSILTIHASSATDALARLEYLATGPTDDGDRVASRVRAAIQHVVFLKREAGSGRRRVQEMHPT